MKKNILVYVLLTAHCLLPTVPCFSQQPGIEWQQTVGGSGLDYFKSQDLTSDGGYIIAAYSYSGISGDKTEANIGSADYWIIKFDAAGTIEWQNTIGGSSSDLVSAIEQTTDGGYIVGGYSKSGISGDKTELNFVGGEGYDYWVIKLDATGAIQWQNTIGGNGDDLLSSIHQTTDGGYIVGGYSSSTLSGDKSEGNMGGSGTNDYWVIKLNSVGGIVWQNTIGADANDVLIDVRETTDGNYIVGGHSDSKKNGDKTIKRWGSFIDYWVMKLNSSGNIIWQKVFGGLSNDFLTCVIQLSDGGYLFGGYSDSDLDGNKTAHAYTASLYDFWIVRTDGSGNMLWDKTLGGDLSDYLTTCTETPDQNILLAGYSISPVSYDKMEPTQGIEDFWIMKLNPSGNTLWENDLGGNINDRPYGIALTGDNGFFVSGYSNSAASGDKTETGSGTYDGWMMKFQPDVCMLSPYYFDFDMDASGDPANIKNACELTYRYVEDQLDCNPLHSNQHLSAPEVCDGIDNDCDGSIDEDMDCYPGPAFLWQNTIGGAGDDLMRTVHPTTGGGSVFIAGSDSDISGDKNANSKGATDYWIVKLDDSGNINWQKTIGGSGYDWPTCISQTPDGGFIAGGYSSSGISGDKTEATMGGDDYWIIKTDALGNIEWQNTIGGNSVDQLYDVNLTSDGGYIAGGRSSSGISGDKTTPNASFDAWILKLNAAGGIEWQRSIRGSLFDYLQTIQQTTDGGYIAGIYSQSGIGLDKTEATQGGYDYWIVKLDVLGNIEWQNTIGGGADDYLMSLEQLPDGGYIAGGTSYSPNFGDKTEALIGESDLWVVRLDALGNIVWQNTIGGTGFDNLSSIHATNDGGFIMGSSSWSDISGDKAENKIIGGVEDGWIIKLNSAGDIVWQNSIGGNRNDVCVNIEQQADGTYISGFFTSSELSADKSENTLNYSDSWVIRLETDCIPQDEICNGIDDNCNGLIDENVSVSISISAGGATTFCQGGAVLLTATYTGTAVQWKKNGVNIAGATASTYNANKSGNYTCETSSTCDTELSNSIVVTVNKNPAASISAGGPTTFCQGGSVTLTEVLVGGSTYQWYKGASAIAGATTTSYIATLAGNYKCRVTKTATGCYKNSNAITVTVPCRENETITNNSITDNSISIYPNPTTGTFTISANNHASANSPLGGQRGLFIYNSIGQLIYSKQIESGTEVNETIDLGNVSSGIYIITVNDGLSSSEQKLIIQ